MIRFAATVLLLFGFLTGCDQNNVTADSQVLTYRYRGDFPIRIVCTTGMVADIATHVGGSHVAVTALMGEGVDPHLYKASPGDVSQLTRADIILYSGLHLEGKLAELLERMGRRKPTLGVAEKVPE